MMACKRAPQVRASQRPAVGNKSPSNAPDRKKKISICVYKITQLIQVYTFEYNMHCLLKEFLIFVEDMITFIYTKIFFVKKENTSMNPF